MIIIEYISTLAACNYTICRVAKAVTAVVLVMVVVREVASVMAVAFRLLMRIAVIFSAEPLLYKRVSICWLFLVSSTPFFGGQ